MNSIIIKKGFQCYTFMDELLAPVREVFCQYNWLITDYECNDYPYSRIAFDGEYVWIKGEEFLDIVDKHKIQFIWAVFSGFLQGVKLDDILQEELPCASDYTGFWETPITTQHSLAEIEICPFDSSFVVVVSKEEELFGRILKTFPESESLEQYNNDINKKYGNT